MGISLEIEISDLTEECVRRLLKDAIKMQSINSMPVGKRKAAMKAAHEASESADKEEEEEYGDNDTNVEIHRGGVKQNIPSITSADLPRGMDVSKYSKKKSKKNG
jgi:hypothetical protein